MSKEKREPRYYEGIEYESEDERLVIIWLLELQDVGYVDKIERARTFVLSEPVVNEWEETVQLKTMTKQVPKKKALIQGHEYTPEFKIVWTTKGQNKFLNQGLRPYKCENLFMSAGVYEGTWISYLEVKPAFDQNNMTRLFKLNQKWMYEKHHIFVNLVEPYSLFIKTFTPQAAMLTATGKPRKVNWEPVRTLQEYLKIIEK